MDRRAAHMITSSQDVLRDPETLPPSLPTPGISVQCWLSPVLSLSVAAGCWTEPYSADPGQRVGSGGGRNNGNAS